MFLGTCNSIFFLYIFSSFYTFSFSGIQIGIILGSTSHETWDKIFWSHGVLICLRFIKKEKPQKIWEKEKGIKTGLFLGICNGRWITNLLLFISALFFFALQVTSVCKGSSRVFPPLALWEHFFPRVDGAVRLFLGPCYSIARNSAIDKYKLST